LRLAAGRPHQEDGQADGDRGTSWAVSAGEAARGRVR
jgi:hypothetical protein